MEQTPQTTLTKDLRSGEALTVRRLFTQAGVHPFDSVELSGALKPSSRPHACASTTTPTTDKYGAGFPPSAPARNAFQSPT